MAVDPEPRKFIQTGIDHVPSKHSAETRAVEANPVAAQLAAVAEVNKPSMTSKGMKKLWAVVSSILD